MTQQSSGNALSAESKVWLENYMKEKYRPEPPEKERTIPGYPYAAEMIFSCGHRETYCIPPSMRDELYCSECRGYVTVTGRVRDDGVITTRSVRLRRYE